MPLMPLDGDDEQSHNDSAAAASIHRSHPSADHFTAAASRPSPPMFAATASSVTAAAAPAPAAASSCIPHGPIRVGHLTLEGGVNLLDMEDLSSSYRAGPRNAQGRLWLDRLHRDGFVLLRRVLPPQAVIEARRVVCRALHDEWGKLDVRGEEPPVLSAESSASTAQLTPAQQIEASPLLRARIAAAAPSSHTHLRSTRSPSSPSSPPPVALEPGVLLTGFRGVTHHPAVMRLLEGSELATLFARVFGDLRQRRRQQQHADKSTALSSPSTFSTAAPSSSSPSPPPPPMPPLAPPATFDTKWCRVLGRGEFTDEHTDHYRFQHWVSQRANASIAPSFAHRGGDSQGGEEQEEVEVEVGARDMFTCWIPLGDYPLAHGTLVVAEGSHKLQGFSSTRRARSHEGRDDEEEKGGEGAELPSDFAEWQAHGGPDGHSPGLWRSTHFGVGDLVVFDLRLVHASTVNQTERFRISLDSRWKPSDEVPPEQREAFRDLRHKVRREGMPADE